MSVDYTAIAALNALSVSEYPNVYFLGPFAERVSFASQQRRALNLFWALEQTKSVRGREVAVIGGGVAGLTAAAAALTCGADVWLYEKEHELCSAQRETDSRYIHPTINFWPDESLQPITDWPFLNWHAAPCREVIGEIQGQWERYFSLTATQVETGTQITGIGPSGGSVQLEIEGGGKRTVDVVVVAVGFGKETGLDGLPAESYWAVNPIDRSQVTKTKKIWISGCGDGGLIDCLRVCYAGFDIGRLPIKAAAALQQLRANIREIEHKAGSFADLDERAKYLSTEYRNLARRPGVKTALSGALAKGKFFPFVHLIHKQAEPFDHRAAPIHRLLFALAIEQGLVKPIHGTLKAGPEGPMLERPDLRHEKIEAVKLVIRHGAGGALESLVSASAIAALKSDEHKKNQDALKVRLWSPHFFEKLQAGQFPTCTRKTREFYLDAVRILQGAMWQQGLTVIGVGVGAAASNQMEIIVTIFETPAAATRTIPAKVFDVNVREKVESEIIRFHGLLSRREKQRSPVICPGAMVWFGDGRQRHVVTCLTTKHARGEVLGLCVTHAAPPEVNSPVALGKGEPPIGTVVDVRQYDGRFADSEDGDIVSIFFSIQPNAPIQAAPGGRMLAGLHRDALALLDSLDARVTKWGPSGETTVGRIVAVSGVAAVQTRKGSRRLTDLIFVEGDGSRPFSEPGDSGSLVVDPDSRAIGVVFAGYSKVTYLLPLATLLDRAGAELLTSESSDSAPDPRTLVELGWLRLDEGNARDAEFMFRRAVDGLTRSLGRENVNTTGALQGLASAYSRQGRAAEAEALLREVIQIRERTLGAQDRTVADALQALGWASGEQGRWDEASELFRRALAILEQISNADAQVAEALRGLGWALRRTAHFREARENLQRALHLRETALGPDDVRVSDDLLELGWLCLDEGNLQEAKSYLDRCLELRFRKFGSEHPQSAAVLQALASVSSRQGRAAESEQLLRTVLAIRQKALGPDHPATAGTLQALGWACGEQGKLAEAAELFRRAVRIREERGNQADAVEALRGLGWVLRRQRQFSEARERLERALRIRADILGPDDIQFSDVLLELGWLCADTGNFENAKQNFEQSLAIRERLLDPDHPHVAGPLQGLASVLTRLGDDSAALKLLERALAIRERSLGPDHPQTASTLQALGWILGNQGKLDDAERFFQRALVIREKAGNPADIAEALRGLGSILRKRQKFKDADTLFQRALEAQQKAQ
jgi:tetratricopeptide (TPR) repeat protein